MLMALAMAFIHFTEGDYVFGLLSTIAFIIVSHAFYLRQIAKRKVWGSSVNVVEFDDDTVMSIIVTIDPTEYMSVQAIPTALGPLIVGPFSFQTPGLVYPKP